MSTDRIIRRKELEFRISLSKSTIYSMMEERKFPRPIKIGKRAVGWPESVIEQWLADRANGRHILEGIRYD
tara:strand:- start:262 stop:474 length:213 start_codon:yes stop_codon:yes gene_type:complete